MCLNNNICIGSCTVKDKEGVYKYNNNDNKCTIQYIHYIQSTIQYIHYIQMYRCLVVHLRMLKSWTCT